MQLWLGYLKFNAFKRGITQDFKNGQTKKKPVHQRRTGFL
jgi:hypothetical protein